METYRAGVPKDATEFVYQGKTYKAGDILESKNPCEILGFYHAFKSSNPSRGRKDADSTSNFWQNIESLCSSGTPGVPVPGNTNPGTEAPPPNKEDSAASQGAPSVPEGLSGVIQKDSDPNNSDPFSEPTRPPKGEKDPAHSDEKAQEKTNAGDPVDIFNGIFYMEETDLEIPNTIFPLFFKRTYQSGRAAFGPFGWNWDHNHNLFLRELNDGSIAIWKNLQEQIFVATGSGFEPPRGVFKKLEQIPSIPQTYELKGPGGITWRFEKPNGWIDGERIPLLWIKDRHGNQLNYSYGSDDKLQQVADDDGYAFQFAYDQCGLLTSVEDQAGRKFTYAHNEESLHLTCAVSPATTDQPKGITRVYHYENQFERPELRHNILRIEDNDGLVYLENKYEKDPASEAYTRVTEQLYGAYLFQFKYTQLQWVPANPLYINIPALRVEVMNPDFGLETYTFNYRGDLIDHRWRLNKDKSFRVTSWQYEYDEQGNIAAITKPDGSRELHTFDAANLDPRRRKNLLQKELTAALGFPSPSRIIWRGNYEPNFQLLKEEINERGAITEYKYDFDLTPSLPSNSGKLKQIIYPKATLPDSTLQDCIAQFEHNSKGQITANIYPDGTREEQEYGLTGNEASRLLRKTTDPSGLNIEHQYSYDNFGYLKEEIDGNGNLTKTKYNALGLLEQQTEAPIGGNEATTSFHYNGDKKIIASHKPKGAYAAITDSHLIDKSEKDVLGFTTKQVLNDNTIEKRVFRFCNDYRGNAIETINPDRSHILKTIDERGLLVYEEHRGKEGGKLFSKNVYDRTGRLIRKIDSAGLHTIFQYDGFGRIVKVDLSNGAQTIKTWDKNDLLLAEEVVGDDGNGVVRLLKKTKYEYDEKDRKVKTIIQSFTNDPSIVIDLEKQFFYDKMDRLVKTKDHRNAEIFSFYDPAGRLIETIDAEGNEKNYTLDNNGNTIRIDLIHREPSGGTSLLSQEFVYDARNRKIQTIESDGAIIFEDWDDRNLLIGQTNLLGVLTTIQYNAFGEKTEEIIDPSGLAIRHLWTIDHMGRIVAYQDPDGQISKYVFDGLGRLVKHQYPNGFISTKKYNELGLLQEEKMGSGVLFEYSYDAANRLATIENPQSPAPITAIPPQEISYDGLDRMVSAKSGSNETLRTFDSLSRLSSETTNGATMEVVYDDLGGFVDKIWPDGRTERYAHNLSGTLSEISQTQNGNLGSINGLIATFSPSGPSHLGQVDYQNNFKIEAQYDTRKRLVEWTIQNNSATNETLKYRYDTGNRRRVEAILGNNPSVNHYNFDAKNRLATAHQGLTSTVPNALNQAQNDQAIQVVQSNVATALSETTFAYNNADERVQHNEVGQTAKNYTYLDGHKIQTDGTNNYTFHTDGSINSDGLQNYEVDAFNRVIRIEQNGNSILDIEYDGLGRPSIIQEAGKPSLSFHYLGGFVEQENHDGSPYRQFTLHPLTGVPLSYHMAGNTYHTLFDSRFNLIAVTDDLGDILTTYRYKAFGVPSIYDASGTAIPSSTLGIDPIFGGQRYLDAVGLYLSKRRLMNPRDGLFLSADPLGYKDSPSLYAYARQNPIDNIDPSGEAVPVIIAVGVIAGALIGAGLTINDSVENPGKYSGPWKPLIAIPNTLAGAAVGGFAGALSHGILAFGTAASSGGAAGLSGAQTFLTYGTASATGGGWARLGFNTMFPEYVAPPTLQTFATDFAVGGGSAAALNGVGMLPSYPIANNGPLPTPQIVPNGSLGAGVNGSASTTLHLVPEQGILGALGLSKPVFSTVVRVVANPQSTTRAGVIRHELRHASDMINFPRLSHLGTHSRLPGRGMAAFLMETRGYYAEFGARGLNPSYAWRSLTPQVLGPLTERHYLIAELLGASAGAGLYAFGGDDDKK